MSDVGSLAMHRARSQAFQFSLLVTIEVDPVDFHLNVRLVDEIDRNVLFGVD